MKFLKIFVMTSIWLMCNDTTQLQAVRRAPCLEPLKLQSTPQKGIRCRAIHTATLKNNPREVFAVTQASRLDGNNKIQRKPHRHYDTHKADTMTPRDEAFFASLIHPATCIEAPGERISKKTTTRAQNIGLNFTAATLANVQDPLVIPPNLNGWVGSEQYILMCYNIIRSFNKTTGQPDGILDIDADSFFGVPANDVRISYDRFLQRWLMSCEGIDVTTGQVATIVLAVSSSDPIDEDTNWDMYTFTNDQVIPQIKPLGSGDLDYQQMAVDKNAVYLSIDTFNKRGNFCGTSTLVIQKNSLGTDTLYATVFPSILPGSTQSLMSGFTPPADNFDTNPVFGYLVNTSNYYYPSGLTYNQLYLYRIINPDSTDPLLGSMVTISVPNYADPANAPYKGNVFGAPAFLQSGIGCAVCAAHIRSQQLFACHNIQVDRTGKGNPKGDRVGVRWYQFDLTGDATGQGRGTETETTIPVLIQSGTLFDATSTTAPLFYYNPSIMTNVHGDLVLACTVSGASAYPNAVYAGRVSTDAAGTLRSPVSLTNSSYSYNFGPFMDSSNANIGQRWGDLSSLCPDPTNDIDMWSTQEFAAVQNGWGIQVTQLIPAA